MRLQQYSYNRSTMQLWYCYKQHTSHHAAATLQSTQHVNKLAVCKKAQHILMNIY